MVVTMLLNCLCFLPLHRLVEAVVMVVTVVVDGWRRIRSYNEPCFFCCRKCVRIESGALLVIRPILASPAVGGVGGQIELGAPHVMVPILFLMLLEVLEVELNQAYR